MLGRTNLFGLGRCWRNWRKRYNVCRKEPREAESLMMLDQRRRLESSIWHTDQSFSVVPPFFSRNETPRLSFIVSRPAIRFVIVPCSSPSYDVVTCILAKDFFISCEEVRIGGNSQKYILL
ncbi:hypothetical protein H6P81_002577 [Aristolochia fimbriata]|uniref:Uncharacterized protein n=1 Tax=Aristolochia fimbriata TaxID=158543 RepID=A0AAV7FAQ7_ARIFI|nr:hypothetical protein H6P81_002577 [Aristolochia fimbriata]